MTFTVAVAGKGGVGKTVFSALAVRHLHESTKEVVLAVDADPNYNLGAKLGTEPGKTIGELREELASLGEEPPPGMAKQEYLEYQIRLALKEGPGFDLLTMGRQEGPGCYCYVNNILRTLIDSLSSRYRYVVIDNEAGMEHLSRRTTRASDVLAVLCDRTLSSQRAAERIARLAEEMRLSIRRKVLVFNGLGPAEERSPAAVPEVFDAVYAVRRSGRLQAVTENDESLMGLPRSDPAFVDVASVIDAERGLG